MCEKKTTLSGLCAKVWRKASGHKDTRPRQARVPRPTKPGRKFSEELPTDSDADPATRRDFLRRSSPGGSRPQTALQKKTTPKTLQVEFCPPPPLAADPDAPAAAAAACAGLWEFWAPVGVEALVGLGFVFLSAFWGLDPSGELRLEKSCRVAGSASESVGI